MWSPDAYKRALDFAARAHGDQKVPGSGAPYVVHVAKVAMEVLQACAHEPSVDADLAMTCALLHDTLEDAGVAVEALRAEFSEAVALGVAALTKDEQLPKAQRMADSLTRVRAQPREVWMVKLADRITNLEPPPPAWTVEKRRQYLAEAHQILEQLRGASPSLEARFELKVKEYERYCT